MSAATHGRVELDAPERDACPATDVASPCDVASPWYAILTKPQRETVAEENLRKQGYRVYLPRLATEQRRNGRWTPVVEPLFPRYLFVATADRRQSFAPIRSTPGVANLVSFGSRAAEVPTEVIETLQRREAADAASATRRRAFGLGDAVFFREGPFAGLEGIFSAETGEQRVLVLLDFLGKLNRIRVDRDWLVPATR